LYALSLHDALPISLNSVRKLKACEFMIPSPAMRARAGFVPSSSGPFGAGRLSARSGSAANPRAAVTVNNLRKTRCISSLLAPAGAHQDYHLSDALCSPPFQPFHSNTEHPAASALSSDAGRDVIH